MDKGHDRADWAVLCVRCREDARLWEEREKPWLPSQALQSSPRRTASCCAWRSWTASGRRSPSMRASGSSAGAPGAQRPTQNLPGLGLADRPRSGPGRRGRVRDAASLLHRGRAASLDCLGRRPACLPAARTLLPSARRNRRLAANLVRLPRSDGASSVWRNVDGPWSASATGMGGMR